MRAVSGPGPWTQRPIFNAGPTEHQRPPLRAEPAPRQAPPAV